eukprot:m.64987 g.64987  ORF g.64987 m.64987 type:complete len:151 (+) comp12038_c0_seq2:2312-2764(+)
MTVRFGDIPINNNETCANSERPSSLGDRTTCNVLQWWFGRSREQVRLCNASACEARDGLTEMLTATTSEVLKFSPFPSQHDGKTSNHHEYTSNIHTHYIRNIGQVPTAHNGHSFTAPNKCSTHITSHELPSNEMNGTATKLQAHQSPIQR